MRRIRYQLPQVGTHQNVPGTSDETLGIDEEAKM